MDFLTNKIKTMKTDNVLQPTIGQWRAMFSELTETNWINAGKKNICILNGNDNLDEEINASEAKANAELIVTAVNACKEINPDNPVKVAELLPEIIRNYISRQHVYELKTSTEMDLATQLS